MIESLDVDGLFGIAGGTPVGLAPRAVLVCDTRARRVIGTALTLLCVDESDASALEGALREGQGGPLPSARELLVDGRARVRARADGRDVTLALERSLDDEVCGTVVHGTQARFAFRVDAEAGRVTPVHGLSHGPRTMMRRLMLVDLLPRDVAPSAVAKFVSPAVQLVVLVVSSGAPDEREAVAGVEPDMRVSHVSVVDGRLRVMA